MKIVFICGSLEPGFDGVGDYTRRLASELIKQNIEVTILALNDQFINEPVTQNQMIGDIGIDTYRIPLGYTTKNRYNFAENWIDSINPEWLSLQFVPFSFNTKGLPFNLSKNLFRLTKDRKWHIMFHELWIGMDKKSSFKHLVWGKVQKILILNLIKTLKPSLISTQTNLYQIYLAKLGYKAEILPLFSNIPLLSSPKEFKDNTQKISFVNFGTIHPGAIFYDFAAECANYAKSNNIEIELILLGRCGAEQEKWVTIWRSAGLSLTVFGEQPTDRVSQILSSATFGISSTALPLIEKSGSVASMHQHKLLVVCVSKSWHPRGVDKVPPTNGVLPYISGNLASILNSKSQVQYNSVTAIAKKMIADFKYFKNN